MRQGKLGQRRPVRRPRGKVSRLELEALEQRRLLASTPGSAPAPPPVPLVVTTTADSGTGSLRQAILDANAAGTPQTIDFAITIGTAPFTISPLTPLPAINVPVTLDGSSQAGYPGIPVIELDGASAGASSDGLDVAGGTSTIVGLAINRFGGAGIKLETLGGDTVAGCFVGTDPSGTKAEGNGSNGILVYAVGSNTIGGTQPGARNVVSGNTGQGIYLDGNTFPNPTPTTNNVIVGNLIGTDVAGGAALPNTQSGIWIDHAASTTIGGTATADRNIISGNKNDGIDDGIGDRSLIQGNYIGTDITGKKTLANSSAGVLFTGGSFVTVGGTTAGAGNLISGNGGSGIDCFVIGSSDDLIEGNLIGTDVSGVKALGNLVSGVRIWGPTADTVGGTATGAGNVISGNAGDGITTFGNTDQLLVEGNFIGTDRSGAVALGNGSDGINIFSNGNTIGGLAPGAGNVIANNGQSGRGDGIRIGLSHLTTILSNSIHDNKGLGINLQNGSGNDAQVAPALTAAASDGTNTTIQGSLQTGVANTTYTVQFFANATPDPSGAGEGQTLLGTIAATTDGKGMVTFNPTFPISLIPGTAVSATATAPYVDSTRPYGNTSQFAQNVSSTGSSDISVKVTSTPPSIEVNQQVTYTIVVTNNGPTASRDVTLTDTLPANVTLVAPPTTTAGTVAVNYPTLTADLGMMAAHSSATITVVVATSTATASSITDTATVSSTEPDPDTTNNQSSATTTVSPVSDLGLRMSGSPGSLPVGQDLTYTLTITNTGPSDANNVVFTDTLPANVTFVSSAVQGVSVNTLPVSGVLTENVGTIPAGQSVTATIVVTPQAAAVGSITNSAVVSSDELDPDSPNNSASVKTTVTPVADVGVTVTGQAPVLVNQNMTFTVTVTNSGPSPATNVTLTDTLPANTNFVSISPNPGGNARVSGGVLTENLGTIAANSSMTLSLILATTSAAAGTATDSATVAATESDPNSQNDSSSGSTTVLPVADLAVSASGPASAYVGQNVTYTLSVSNNGPSTATGVAISDLLPANVAFVSATSSQGLFPTEQNGVVAATVGTLGVGATATVSVVVSPQAAAVGQATQQVTVSGNEADPVPANDSASVTTTVAPAANLSLRVAGTPNPVLAGASETYTMTLTNNGPSPATNVTLTDTLPAGTSFVSVTPNPGNVAPVGGTLTLDLGTLPAAGFTTITLVVLPTSGGATITNTAQVAATEFDPSSGDNTATTVTTVTPVANLVTKIAASPAPTTLGQPVTYVVTVLNQGPSDAPSVVLNDALPVGATLGTDAASQGTALQNGAALTAKFGTIAAGASASLTFVVTPTVGGSLVDTATATADIFDNSPQDGSATLTTAVTEPPGTLQISPATVAVNETAGSASFIVSRTDGTQGQVTIHYATVGGSAHAGVDYTPVSGSLVFNDGEASKTITIPVLANPNDSHDETVNVQIDSPTGGATLGAQTTGTLTIHDTDPNLTGIQFVDLHVGPASGGSATQIVLVFTAPLDPATATRLANYTVYDLGRSGTYGGADTTRLTVAAANYTAGSNTVTLTVAAPFHASRFYGVHIQATGTGAVSSPSGVPLNGSPALPAGANVDDSVALGTNLHYVDQAGHAVSIQLRRAGVLELTRNAAGQGLRLSLLNAVPGRSVLSGHSRGGETSFNTLTGLGYFGDVLVKMSTPPFFVVQPSYPPGRRPSNSFGAVTAASVSTAVPAGPQIHRAIQGAAHRHRHG